MVFLLPCQDVNDGVHIVPYRVPRERRGLQDIVELPSDVWGVNSPIILAASRQNPFDSISTVLARQPGNPVGVYLAEMLC